MKKLLVGAVLALSSLSVFAADIGPFYVSSDGYCNIREIYVTDTGYVYGTEIGCTESKGTNVVGYITTTGGVFLAYSAPSGSQCIGNFRGDNSVTNVCGNGSGVAPGRASTWTLSTTRP